MTDVLTTAQRQYCMSQIQGKNTKPEIIVRKVVHALGYRFRLHCRDLPGCPDLVFPRLMKIIFVHGCFWHRHNCRYGQAKPATRREFWEKKLEGNKRRDKKNRQILKKMGWDILVIWECQTIETKNLTNRLKRFLKT